MFSILNLQLFHLIPNLLISKRFGNMLIVRSTGFIKMQLEKFVNKKRLKIIEYLVCYKWGGGGAFLIIFWLQYNKRQTVYYSMEIIKVVNYFYSNNFDYSIKKNVCVYIIYIYKCIFICTCLFFHFLYTNKKI